MSAVKNLRAMFEQKGDSSPPAPDRGRSPGIPHGAEAESPRPLAKVRTSFIAIAKEGRMGLQREGSQDSISALRKHSGDSTATTPTTATERSNPFDIVTKTPAKTTIPTRPLVETPPRVESPPADSGIKDSSPPVQEKQAAVVESPPVQEEQAAVVESLPIQEEQAVVVESPPAQEEPPVVVESPPVQEEKAAVPEPSPVQEDPPVVVEAPPVEEEKAAVPESPPAPEEKAVVLESPPIQQEQAAVPEPPSAAATELKKPEANGVDKEVSTAETATPRVETANGTSSTNASQDTAAKETSKPAARTTKPVPKPLRAASTTRLAVRAEKSPTVQRAPRSPAATQGHHASTKKTPEKKAQPPAKPATPRATAPSKPPGPSSVKKPPPLQSSPASTGFVKPKVKSPTRPINLPPGLTAHTASSGSRIGLPRRSLSRASGSVAPADGHTRPASRASGSTAGSGGSKSASTRGLGRQGSIVNNRPSRPSLGPPPKQATKDYPPTNEKEIDQGFLARMMRPTAASASKTTEKKIVTSPPRRTVAAPKKVAATKPVKKAVHKAGAEAAAAANESGDEAVLPQASEADVADETTAA